MVAKKKATKKAVVNVKSRPASKKKVSAKRTGTVTVAEVDAAKSQFGNSNSKFFGNKNTKWLGKARGQ